mgnify:FL=1
MFSTVRTWWAYLTFYWSNSEEIKSLGADLMSVVRRALALVERFKKENPDVPVEWLPKPVDAVKAIADQKVGKTDVLTPKPVDQWTMREWENYWRLGDGASGW